MLFHEGYWSFKIHWIYLLCVWRPKIRIFDIQKKAKVPTTSEEKICCGPVSVPDPFYYKTTIRTFLLLKIRITKEMFKSFPLEGSTNIYFYYWEDYVI